jgi:myosin heavy subunit
MFIFAVVECRFITCAIHLIVDCFCDLMILLFLLQIGKTKVLLRVGEMAKLDACRSEVLRRSSGIIQRKVLSYLARKSFVLLRQSVIQIQAACRGI